MTRSAVGDGSAVGGATNVPLSLGDGDAPRHARACDGPGDAAGAERRPEDLRAGVVERPGVVRGDAMRYDDSKAEDQDDHHDLRPQPSAWRHRDDGGVPDRYETPQPERAQDDERGQRERRIDELGGEVLDTAQRLDANQDDQDQDRDREDGRCPSPTNIELAQAREEEREGTRLPPATQDSGRCGSSRGSDRSKRRHDSTGPRSPVSRRCPVTGRLLSVGDPRSTVRNGRE